MIFACLFAVSLFHWLRLIAAQPLVGTVCTPVNWSGRFQTSFKPVCACTKLTIIQIIYRILVPYNISFSLIVCAWLFGYMGRARRLEMLARGDCKWSVPSAHISQEIRWASWPLDKWVLDGWILAPQLVMPRFQCRSSCVGTLWGSPLLISSRDEAFYTSGWTQDFWLPINLVGTCQRFVY